ncbi:DUF262 domain-containing protein [Clostridium baratii]|uniref:DUF262 domain-containing protein n=1 Tax=Clostridium baratii TaxID=1561 RepID=UPI0028FE0498|nr:DUF262 domain-containing protein [Clostridium baratii]MDU1053775.1 DUF262 domain-containing protein [Clostridium baratii]
MKKNNIVNIKSENEENYSNDDLYNIMSWGADLSFRELISMYEEDELMKPELQRNYVWDKKEASRFIESILLGLPVPSIFLAKLPNDKQLIIDGFQRIMTVYGYVKGIFSKDNSVFKLSNSNIINERWRGKTYEQLTDDDKRKIRNYYIHAIVFEQKYPRDDDTSLHQIFERINTGGRTLNNQEIRNCVSQGAFNALLIELNKNSIWRKLYGEEKFDSRMKDIELILRFFTIHSDDIRKSSRKQISLKNSLDKFMNNKVNNEDEKIIIMKENFEKTIDYIFDRLGETAFNNYSFDDGKYIKKFHPTIYDSIMIATLECFDNIHSINDLNKRKMELLQDNDYKRYISERTTNVENINGRINKAKEILYGITNK